MAMTASVSHPARHPAVAITAATTSGRMVSPSPVDMMSSDIARPRRRTNHFVTADVVPISNGVENIRREMLNAT